MLGGGTDPKVRDVFEEAGMKPFFDLQNLEEISKEQLIAEAADGLLGGMLSDYATEIERRDQRESAQALS